MPALSLADNLSAVTAIANDYSYGHVRAPGQGARIPRRRGHRPVDQRRVAQRRRRAGRGRRRGPGHGGHDRRPPRHRRRGGRHRDRHPHPLHPAGTGGPPAAGAHHLRGGRGRDRDRRDASARARSPSAPTPEPGCPSAPPTATRHFAADPADSHAPFAADPADRRAPFAAGTVITSEYLPWARVLAASFAVHHPGVRFVVTVLDEPDPGRLRDGDPFELARPADIGLAGAEYGWLRAIYDGFELCCAVKPWLLRYLLAGADAALYLDSDILVCDSLAAIAAQATDAGVVLTPHALTPLPDDGLVPSEDTLLRLGQFNAGFVAVGHRGAAFLGLVGRAPAPRVHRVGRAPAAAFRRPALAGPGPQLLPGRGAARPGRQRRLLERGRPPARGEPGRLSRRRRAAAVHALQRVTGPAQRAQQARRQPPTRRHEPLPAPGGAVRRLCGAAGRRRA